jgi:drug/metabolite transporter (DMT)-like permease
LLGELSAILCAVCYALSYIFIRKGQKESSPPDHGLFPILLISALALGVASIALCFTNPSVGRGNWQDLQAPILHAALSGLVGTMIGRLLLYRAIHDLGATRGVVIKGLSPMVTLLVVFLLLKQPMQEEDFIGLACLISAIMLLFLERKYSPLRSLFPFPLFRNGVFIAVMAAVAQGIGHSFRQMSVAGVLHPIFGAAIDATTALVAYLVYLLVRGKLGGLLCWYRKSMDSSLFIAGLCSALAMLLFFVAVEHLPVSTVSVLAATEPVFVALFSALFFPRLERITWWSATASMIVAGGIILISL